jgi:hypothetical protein
MSWPPELRRERRVRPTTTPTDTRLMIKFDPPALRNGNEIPFGGRLPVTTPMFNAA